MVTARKKQQAQIQIIRATCAATDLVGDAVYVNAPAGAYYSVSKVDVTLGAKMPSIGVIISKISLTNAIVQLWGEVKNIYSGLSPGRSYVIGGDSRPTLLVPPAPPGVRVYAQIIGVALDAGVLLLKPSEHISIRVG